MNAPSATNCMADSVSDTHFSCLEINGGRREGDAFFTKPMARK